MEGLVSSVKTTTVTDQSLTPVVELYTDCLVKVFSYLDMLDLLSVEQVCHSWKEAALISWKRFTEFDCNKVLTSMSANVVQHVLKQCGSHLKIFHFPACGDFFDNYTYKAVDDYCLNLTDIIFENPQYASGIFELISNVVSKSQVIECRGFYGELHASRLRYLLKAATNLHTLRLSDTYYQVFDGLQNVFCTASESLREIHFGKLRYFCPKIIEVLSKRCPRLEIITVTANFRNVLKKETLSKLSTLKRLELIDCGLAEPELSAILTLHKLEKLVLVQCHLMSDEFLTDLPKNLPLLRYLDISCAALRDVTDEGLFGIAELDNLIHLNMSCYYSEFTDSGFGAITLKGKLKQLILISTNIGDNALSNIAHNCHELELLHILGCKRITEEGIITLANILCTASKYRPTLKVILSDVFLKMWNSFRKSIEITW